ncbi:MAG TPA: right-handed parallel beta-helix repeat-containing protein [Planctomycetota bacterium]|nr:right-handed parallel beta-helix repeat-containing protein [Planctomycetota bacterium]
MLPAQATVLVVSTNSEIALENAILAANALAFQTSSTQPVVIEFASNLIGQTIFLTHALPLLVVDHVTMRVASAGPTARVVLDGANAPTVFRITSRHARVQNVRFQNAGPPGSLSDGFTAYGTDDLTVANCDFDGAGGNGLWLIGSTATTVQDCSFRWNGSGLVATGGTADLAVQTCTFLNNQRGAMQSGGDHMQFLDCTFDGNGLALALQPVCADMTFGPGNVVRNGGNFPSIAAAGAVRLRIVGSQFLDNQKSAIQLSDLCADVTIADNTLTRNGIPGGVHQIVVDDCLGVRITGLQCTAGGAGIFAGTTGQFDVSGSAASPVVIDGNDRGGITLSGCTESMVAHVSVNDNLQSAGGVQVFMFNCTGVDLIDSSITAAPGPGRLGLQVEGCNDIHVGLGVSVFDNGAVGVLVANSHDVVLGNWPGQVGALSVRGPSPLQILDCVRVQVNGTAAAPCALLAGPGSTAPAVFLLRCQAACLGPDVLVDCVHAASTALQITDSTDVSCSQVTIRGHTGWGLVGAGTTQLRVLDCTVDGGVGATAATAIGMLLNGGCHGAQLLGNYVRGQLGSAFVAIDSNDVWFGPGNRAIDNAGDGFAVRDVGPGPATRRTTIQSCVAVGRNLATQSGFVCANVLARLTNVTATRQGTGVLLQNASQATIVNTISWGNMVDRSRDAASVGTWRHGLRSTSAGTGSPGSWIEQNMLLGVNPQFVSAATGDVRLAPGSPAIDSGLHATPVGSGLPCVDAELLPRVRGGVVDRGAIEFVPTVGTGNSLDLAGPWLRTPAESRLAFTVRATAAQAGQMFVLFVSGSGTGPGAAVPTGQLVPLVPDGLTALLLAVPALSVGNLDGTGTGGTTLSIPPDVTPFLPELSFAAVITTVAAPTNPVVVRFQR